MTSFSSLSMVLSAFYANYLDTNRICFEFRMDALTFIMFFAINCSLFSPCVPKHFKFSLSDNDSLFVGNLLFSAIPTFVKWLWVYEKLTFVRFTLLEKKRCSITLIYVLSLVQPIELVNDQKNMRLTTMSLLNSTAN